MVKYAGIDLAGSPRNPSGVAILDSTDTISMVFIGILHNDDEIIELLTRFKPVVVAIDAPLSHSRGYREVDRLLLRHNYRVLPPGWRGMSMLVDRALTLVRSLTSMGIKVIETHPRSALKSSGCRSPSELAERIGLSFEKRLSRDEEDALVASVVAYGHDHGYTVVFRATDGEIILLKPICTGNLSLMQHANLLNDSTSYVV